MSILNRTCRSIGLIVLSFCPLLAFAQWDRKPYTEWSRKEALRLLNDSPWGQTQTVTQTASMSASRRRLDSGQTQQSEAPQLYFRIRFISAKPIRQAVSRSMELQQKGRVSEQLAQQLQAFANADFPDYIVVTVLCESDGANPMLQEATALFNKLNTSDLQNNTYLLARDGRHLFLREYQAAKDGLGVRFIFPRIVDGKPFLTPESGDVQFYSELGNLFKVEGKTVVLNMRYKVKDMTFGGKLEY